MRFHCANAVAVLRILEGTLGVRKNEKKTFLLRWLLNSNLFRL